MHIGLFICIRFIRAVFSVLAFTVPSITYPLLYTDLSLLLIALYARPMILHNWMRQFAGGGAIDNQDIPE